MTAAEDSPQLPGWAEPDGIRPRPRSGRLRNFGALVGVAVLTVAFTPGGAGASSAPVGAPDGYPTLVAKPLDGKCWFTDTWGDPRPGGRVHEGIDIGAAAGTPLFAVTDGVIAKQYFDKPGWRGGNAIRLTMPDGTYFFYGHMSSFAEGIAPGVPVTAGTVIGYVGMTGNAGVNHLHFEVHPQGGKPINPYPLARSYGICHDMGRAQPPPATTIEAESTVPASSLQGVLPSAPATDPQLDAPPGGTVIAALVLEPVPNGTAACTARYAVRPGDYWYFIAAATKLKPSRLASATQRTIESFIYPDERLCIPDASWSPTSTSAAAPVTTTTKQPAAGSGSTAAPSSTVAGNGKTPPGTKCTSKYTVNTDDYWYMVATWFQVRVARLTAANGRTIDSPIYPGETLCIP